MPPLDLQQTLATFRTPRIARLSWDLEVGEETQQLSATLVGDNGIVKIYHLECLGSEVVKATVDKANYSTQVIAEAGELNK